MGKNSSILLLALIEDILDLSKMEAGTFSIHNTEFSIPQLMDQISDIFGIQCQQKKIKLIFDIEPCFQNERVFSDENRIKQVLLNIMSNAVKFTFMGSITVSISLELRRQLKKLVFTIKDTGLGIKEEDKPKLFSLFGMVSEVKGLNPNGSGIGLTVCQKYLERLGGGISLDSEFGTGTTVTFWVPYKNCEENKNKEIVSDVSKILKIFTYSLYFPYAFLDIPLLERLLTFDK